MRRTHAKGGSNSTAEGGPLGVPSFLGVVVVVVSSPLVVFSSPLVFSLDDSGVAGAAAFVGLMIVLWAWRVSLLGLGYLLRFVIRLIIAAAKKVESGIWNAARETSSRESD
jgi:hypothetical protein